MFYLFAGLDYYPEGGVHDFITSGAVVDDLWKTAIRLRLSWWHIADETMTIVESSYGI